MASLPIGSGAGGEVRRGGSGSRLAASVLFAGCSIASGGAGVARVDATERPEARVASAATELARGEPIPLVLRRAVPLELASDVEGEFQPSALLFSHGQLLTVSDKHDRAIFAIDVESSSANVRPFVLFEPPSDEPPPLDYEGLSPAPGGGWVVSSEAKHRLLEVDLDVSDGAGPVASGHAHWLTPSLHGLAGACLGTPNAGLEGVTLTQGDHFLLAAERDPRGLIEVAVSGDPSSVQVFMPDPSYAFEPPRNADYADLTQSGQHTYALVRNHHLVVRLERTAAGFREGPAFSYRGAEEDPRFRYEDRKYGMGEGLAIVEHEIFIVLDNNGNAREVDASDRRPQLFVFERPSEL